MTLNDVGISPNPKYKGAGSYPPGNPFANSSWGGGAGCHFSGKPYGCHADCTNDIDQINRSPINLVYDFTCQCNYHFNSNWGQWVNALGNISKEMNNGILPEAAQCWTNNVFDMINLANWLFWRRGVWYNDPNAPGDYWGWNEVPMGRAELTNQANWDAVVIKMPVYLCGGNGGNDHPRCLSKDQSTTLETDLSAWVNQGYLQSGSANINEKPSSTLVLMREWYKDGNGTSASWSVVTRGERARRRREEGGDD